MFRSSQSLRRLGATALGIWLIAGALVPSAAYAQEQDSAAASSRPTLLISKYAAVPPLPYPGPLPAPVREAVVEDDVDKRSTAFIPRDLTMLSPLEEMPEDEARWIRVDLSEQLLVVYEDGEPIRGFVISSGLPGTPTVTGTFRIRMKVRSQTMEGGDPALGNYYNLPNVEWVQYFFADYGFHGTYWHNNFGNPMSHGCINMTNADAKWLFDWAGPEWDGKSVWYSSTDDNPGTLVIVTE